MADPALDLEWIVKEVVRRLTAQARDKKEEKSTATGTGTSNAAGNTSSELYVPAQVVSLARLEGRLAGVTRIVVRPGAIITPAVRDELRARRIAIAEGT